MFLSTLLSPNPVQSLIVQTGQEWTQQRPTLCGSALQSQSHKIRQQKEQISFLRHYMTELTDRQDTTITALSTQLNSFVEQMQRLQIQPAVADPTSTRREVWRDAALRTTGLHHHYLPVKRLGSPVKVMALVSFCLARQLGLKLFTLEKAKEANAIDSQLIYKVTQITQTLKLSIPDSEMISFHIFDIPQSLLLGHPWLSQHNPYTNWATVQIISWSKNYEELLHASAPLSVVRSTVPA